MIRIIIALGLMHSLIAQADVVHHIQFCAGKFCAATAPLSITQQLELNQQFEEGNLAEAPTDNSTSNNGQNNQTRLASSLVRKPNQQGLADFSNWKD